MATQNQTSGIINIQVKNLRNTEGVLHFAVFNSPEGFPGSLDGANLVFETELPNTSPNVTVPELPFGTYAIVAYHDENRNHVLDTNYKHLPKEGYGFSGKVDTEHHLHLKFEDAAFAHQSAETTVVLTIAYPKR
jgi:uncharacterized protein (DUF2141 family)